MRWWAILLPAAVLPIALPQPAWFDAYLLPAPVTLRGTVVDSNNQPLAGASISGVEEDGEFVLRLDVAESGGFNLRTRSPSLVFRKQGFESRFVRLTGGEDMRIVLGRASTAQLPECHARTHCEEGSVFCLPERSGLRRSGRPGPIIDASVTTFVPLKQLDAHVTLTHGGGASWQGEPRLRQIWSSVKYTEQQKQAHGLTVIDARGTTVAGKLWRNIGVNYETRSGGEPYHVGESLFYQDLTREDAAVFDQVLDNLCVSPSAPK